MGIFLLMLSYNFWFLVNSWLDFLYYYNNCCCCWRWIDGGSRFCWRRSRSSLQHRKSLHVLPWKRKIFSPLTLFQLIHCVRFFFFFTHFLRFVTKLFNFPFFFTLTYSLIESVNVSMKFMHCYLFSSPPSAFNWYSICFYSFYFCIFITQRWSLLWSLYIALCFLPLLHLICIQCTIFLTLLFPS